MTKQKTPQSGLSKILPYQALFNNLELLRNQYCYIIEHYGLKGFAVNIEMGPESTRLQIGDWSGDVQDPSEEIKDFIGRNLYKVLEVLKYARAPACTLYFSNLPDPKLCDIRVDRFKMMSPGFITELFGNSVKIQNVKKIEVIDDRSLEYIALNQGSYYGDLIIKPSVFKLLDGCPAYVEILR